MKNVGENVQEREPLCTARGNVNWYNHYGKSTQVPKVIKIEPLKDPAIPFSVLV